MIGRSFEGDPARAEYLMTGVSGIDRRTPSGVVGGRGLEGGGPGISFELVRRGSCEQASGFGSDMYVGERVRDRLKLPDRLAELLSSRGVSRRRTKQPRTRADEIGRECYAIECQRAGCVVEAMGPLAFDAPPDFATERVDGRNRSARTNSVHVVTFDLEKDRRHRREGEERRASYGRDLHAPGEFGSFFRGRELCGEESGRERAGEEGDSQGFHRGDDLSCPAFSFFARHGEDTETREVLPQGVWKFGVEPLYDRSAAARLTKLGKCGRDSRLSVIETKIDTHRVPQRAAASARR